MEIRLHQISKKFNKEWIFRKIDKSFKGGERVALIGPNGSGKSTLLKVISGNLLPSEGKIEYNHHGQSIEEDRIYRFLSMASPELSLPEDFTLSEMISFHFKFKNLKGGVDFSDLPALFKLEKAKDKYIKNFSTGMKQRVKLGLAFYADTPLVLLDEPATNLDTFGFEWYLEETEKISKEKLIFVCSNRKDEYSFCETFVDISDYK